MCAHLKLCGRDRVKHAFATPSVKPLLLGRGSPKSENKRGGGTGQLYSAPWYHTKYVKHVFGVQESFCMVSETSTFFYCDVKCEVKFGVNNLATLVKLILLSVT